MALVATAIILTSCSSGPEPPKLGTPAFYWAAAKETYAAGDYQKAVQHLEAICKKQSEFTARAQAWHLVLTSGMAKGYIELADQFELGTKANRVNRTPFRREMVAHRTYANQLALEFGNVFESFEKGKDAKIALDFAYPTGSANASAEFSKIAEGKMPSETVREDVRRKAIQTAVLLAATRAVGAADDVAKAQELFKTLPVQVPRETFLTAMASAMHEQARMYVRDKLDEPERLKFFASHALDVVNGLPENAELKTLTGKIQKTLKPAKD